MYKCLVLSPLILYVFSLSESILNRGDWKAEGEIVEGVVKTAQGGGDGKEIG